MGNESIVNFSVENNVGWIELNRAKALNALSYEMVKLMNDQLNAWKQNDDVAMVCLYSSSDRAFCAGGDIRSLYDARETNIDSEARDFFVTEYELDMAIHNYPKPILVYMNGIVMGGGVGISIGGQHRIVTEKTKWAMPEANIGFFPDVGASYFMNQMPGHAGRYLAFTGQMIGASDVLYIGGADRFMESERWDELRKALKETTWTGESMDAQLSELLDCFTSTAPESSLTLIQEKIDQHFLFNTAEEIVSSLEKASELGEAWEKEVLDVLKGKSPTSLKVMLHQLIEGKDKDLLDCFKMELALGMNLVKSADFSEGVRAVLVDKDNSPKWNPSSLEEVRMEDVLATFQYDWGKEGNPLARQPVL